MNKKIIIFSVITGYMLSFCGIKFNGSTKDMKDKTFNILKENLKNNDLKYYTIYNREKKYSEQELSNIKFSDTQYGKYVLDTIQHNMNQITENQIIKLSSDEIIKKLGFESNIEYLNIKKIKAAIKQTKKILTKQKLNDNITINGQKNFKDIIYDVTKKLDYTIEKKYLRLIKNDINIYIKQNKLNKCFSKEVHYKKIFKWITNKSEHKLNKDYQLFIINLKSVLYCRVINPQNEIIFDIFQFLISYHSESIYYLYNKYKLVEEKNNKLLEKIKIDSFIKKFKPIRFKFPLLFKADLKQNFEKIKTEIINKSNYIQNEGYDYIFKHVIYNIKKNKCYIRNQINHIRIKSLESILKNQNFFNEFLNLIKKILDRVPEAINHCSEINDHLIESFFYECLSIKDNLGSFLKNQNHIISQLSELVPILKKIIYMRDCKGLCRGLSFVKGLKIEKIFCDEDSAITNDDFHLNLARLHLIGDIILKDKKINLRHLPYSENVLNFINEVIKYQGNYNSKTLKINKKQPYLPFLYNKDNTSYYIVQNNQNNINYRLEYIALLDDILDNYLDKHIIKLINQEVSYLKLKSEVILNNIKKNKNNIYNDLENSSFIKEIEKIIASYSKVYKDISHNPPFFLYKIYKPFIVLFDNTKFSKDNYQLLKKIRESSPYKSEILLINNLLKLIYEVNESQSWYLLSGKYKKKYYHLLEALESIEKNQAIKSLELLNKIYYKKIFNVDWYKDNYVNQKNINTEQVWNNIIFYGKNSHESKTFYSDENFDAYYDRLLSTYNGNYKLLDFFSLDFANCHNKIDRELIINYLKEVELHKIIMFTIYIVSYKKKLAHGVLIRKVGQDKYYYYDPNLAEFFNKKIFLSYKEILKIIVKTRDIVVKFNKMQKGYTYLYSCQIFNLIKK